MQLDLIQDDIDLGIRKNSRRCPFARAFRRAFPHADEISVWCYDVIVRHGNTITKYAWKDTDFHFVLSGYDAGHTLLSPGRFVFTKIDEYTISL